MNLQVYLSLSVRFAEEFHSKEKAFLPLAPLAELAAQAGFAALCMRASQVGIHSAPEAVEAATRILAANGLAVSMVTGDFNVVYNNDQGPAGLRHLEPYIRLAAALKTDLIRVALKHESDLDWARRAADVAAQHGIRLAHQCHTQSLFETVDGIAETLRRIDRPNFGLIYEPANLELCGQDYGPQTIDRLAPAIFNVYLQNQIIRPTGAVTLNTWCRGPVPFDLAPIHAGAGIAFDRVFAGLAAIGYSGPLTVHQARVPGEEPLVSATATARYLAQLAEGSGLNLCPKS